MKFVVTIGLGPQIRFARLEREELGKQRGLLEGLTLLGISHRTIRHRGSEDLVQSRVRQPHQEGDARLGEELRRKRLALSLTTKQVAKLLGLGICASSVSLWERRVRYPRPCHRRKIVEFIGFDPESVRSTGDF